MIEAVLLYNPAAGRVPLSDKCLKRLLERLYRLGIRSEAVAACPEGKKLTLMLKNKDLLIVYGGDGTIHQALGEAVRWDVPIALLPAGTANILARELRIPRDIEQALAVVARKRLRWIHLGCNDGHFFHVMAGVGLDAYILEHFDEKLKRVLGIAAYWVAGIKEFWRYPLRQFQVEVHGEVHTATFAVISKTRYYGGHLLVTPYASLDEDLLDICLFTATRHIRFLFYLLGVILGRHVHYSDVIYRRARRVSISGNSAVRVQLDGELAGRIPTEFSCFSKRLKVVVP